MRGFGEGVGGNIFFLIVIIFFFFRIALDLLKNYEDSEFTSDWDLNPRGQDLNPAKILLGTLTHMT